MPYNIKKMLMNIRSRRDSLRYSQEYMAAKLNLSQHAYSKIECGVTQITVKRLSEIADILLTKPSELLDD